MINLKLLCKGLRGVLTPSEFITLFVIENALGRTNEWRKLYNEMIADLTGLSISQVKRITHSLVEKGFISKKTLQISRAKRETLYRLNLAKLEQKSDENALKFEQENSNSEFTGEPLKECNIIEKKCNINENNSNNCKQYDDGLPF